MLQVFLATHRPSPDLATVVGWKGRGVWLSPGSVEAHGAAVSLPAGRIDRTSASAAAADAQGGLVVTAVAESEGLAWVSRSKN